MGGGPPLVGGERRRRARLRRRQPTLDLSVLLRSRSSMWSGRDPWRASVPLRSDGRCDHGGTVAAVTVRKLSVALDGVVAEEAAHAAERAGMSLSAWLNRAAENELATEAGLVAVRSWEADHGELTAAELAAADDALDRVLSHPRRRTG